MPISCHFLDYKVLLVMSLTRVSSARASTRPLPLLLPLLLQLPAVLLLSAGQLEYHWESKRAKQKNMKECNSAPFCVILGFLVSSIVVVSS